MVADFTTEDIDRIECAQGRTAQFTGPRALAGVIQIFTKQGTGTPGVMFAAEGGSSTPVSGMVSERRQSRWLRLFSRASRLDTENARRTTTTATRPRSASRLVAYDEQLRIGSLFTLFGQRHRTAEYYFLIRDRSIFSYGALV